MAETTDGTQGTVALDLRIMASSDVHMHVLPYDYVLDAASEQFGFARIATLIRQARKEATNTLLFDNGDLFHGTPLGDAYSIRQADPTKRDPAHPVMLAMNGLGYDAMTLGNHDFDHGISALSTILRQARFPVVTSNAVMVRHETDLTAPPRPMVEPFALLDREFTDTSGRAQRLRIGVLGFLPPGTVRDLRDKALRVQTNGIVESARIMAPHLRAMGADLVIALAHSGIDMESDDPALENAVVPLANIPEIDAIIAGHDHQVFPGPMRRACPAADIERGTIHGTPVVSPGFWGSHLGLIDLRLCRDGDGRWRVEHSTSAARPVASYDAKTCQPRASVEPDPQIVRQFATMHEATLDLVRQEVGQTDTHMHSYFAMIAPSAAQQLIHDAKRWFARRALAGTELAELPLLTSCAPFKVGGPAGPTFYTHIKPGPINLRAIADLYMHRNDICALQITGAELIEWLERGASVFCQIAPGGSDQELTRRETPAYLFECVDGVDYHIDLSQPARYEPDGALIDPNARRITKLCYNGAPVTPEQRFILATNSHRATGGGRFWAPGREGISLEDHVSVRQVILSYIKAHKTVSPKPDMTWRFAPLPGTSVQFRSAPQAEAFMADLDHLVLDADEMDAKGFRQFTLHL